MNFSTKVQELIECSICFEIMFEPASLTPCLHSFCGKCISQSFKSSAKCPICNQFIGSVHRNRLVQSLVESFLAEHPGLRWSPGDQGDWRKLNTIQYDKLFDEDDYDQSYQGSSEGSEGSEESEGSESDDDDSASISHIFFVQDEEEGEEGSEDSEDSEDEDEDGDISEGLFSNALLARAQASSYFAPNSAEADSQLLADFQQVLLSRGNLITCANFDEASQVLNRMVNTFHFSNWEMFDQTNLIFKLTEANLPHSVSLFTSFPVNINLRWVTRSGLSSLTPLMLAAVRGYADIVKILLNLSRVDIESRYEYSEFYSNLSTALHLACQEGHSEIVRLLCDKSANLNAQDRDGRTPLHIATRHKRLSCIEILLNRGCDISIVDREGRTAVNYLDNLSQTELTSEVRRVQRLFRALKRSQPTSVVSESSSSRRRRL